MCSLEQVVKTHQHLLRLLRFQPGRYLFMTATRVIIFMAIPQVLGFLTHQFFEGLTGGAMISFSPYAICAFMVATGVARSGFIFIDIPNHFAAQFQAGALMRKNLISALLDRPGASALPDSTGEAISRFRGDVDQVTNYVSQLPFQVGNVLFAAIAFYVMFQIHALVSLVVFLPFLFIIVILNYTLHRVRRFRQASREAAGRVTGFIGEIFEDALAIKLANAEDRIAARLETLNEDRRRLTVRDTLFNRVVDSLIWNATNLGTGLVLVLVGSAMQEGTFSVGDFALFVYYLGFTSMVVQGSARTIAQYKQTGVAVDRLHALLQKDPQTRLTEHSPVYLRGPLPSIPALPVLEEDALSTIRAEGLSYRFPGTENGIADIDLILERGTFTVVTGRIGSGKTTLLRVLLGLLPKDAGSIDWNDVPVGDPASHFVPPRCAYTGQIPRLFSDTLKDNILLGLPEESVDLDGAIQLAQLQRDLNDLDKGLETLVGSRGVKLSGGQVQRTAAARMLVRSPRFLVFDDLSSALDVETERLLWQGLFARQGHATTCLVVSHRRPALRRADQILLLENGRLLGTGKLDALLEDHEEMRRLWSGEIE